MTTRASRAIDALRKPDASLSHVPNTVRQSIAEVIEDQQAALLAVIKWSDTPVLKADKNRFDAVMKQVREAVALRQQENAPNIKNPATTEGSRAKSGG